MGERMNKEWAYLGPLCWVARSTTLIWMDGAHSEKLKYS